VKRQLNNNPGCLLRVLMTSYRTFHRPLSRTPRPRAASHHRPATASAAKGRHTTRHVPADSRLYAAQFTRHPRQLSLAIPQWIGTTRRPTRLRNGEFCVARNRLLGLLAVIALADNKDGQLSLYAHPSTMPPGAAKPPPPLPRPPCSSKL